MDHAHSRLRLLDRCDVYVFTKYLIGAVFNENWGGKLLVCAV